MVLEPNSDPMLKAKNKNALVAMHDRVKATDVDSYPTYDNWRTFLVYKLLNQNSILLEWRDW